MKGYWGEVFVCNRSPSRIPFYKNMLEKVTTRFTGLRQMNGDLGALGKKGPWWEHWSGNKTPLGPKMLEAAPGTELRGVQGEGRFHSAVLVASSTWTLLLGLRSGGGVLLREGGAAALAQSCTRYHRPSYGSFLLGEICQLTEWVGQRKQPFVFHKGCKIDSASLGPVVQKGWVLSQWHLHLLELLINACSPALPKPTEAASPGWGQQCVCMGSCPPRDSDAESGLKLENQDLVKGKCMYTEANAD